MPIYEYQSIEPCERCGGRFTKMRKLSDPPLEQCPDCMLPCRQLISAPSVIAGQAHLTDPKKAAEKGFTQYRRVGQGVYEKTGGKGPRYIADDGK